MAYAHVDKGNPDWLRAELTDETYLVRERDFQKVRDGQEPFSLVYKVALLGNRGSKFAVDVVQQTPDLTSRIKAELERTVRQSLTSSRVFSPHPSPPSAGLGSFDLGRDTRSDDW